MPAGRVILATRHIAYLPTEGEVVVRAGEGVQVEVRVADQVLDLDPLVVTARTGRLLMDERLGGFFIRRARGMGRFIDREERRPQKGFAMIVRLVPGEDRRTTAT